jgi:predicted transcriptional regulator
MRTAVISIHEEFAQAIFQGKKRYEFRTRAPVLDGPTKFQVYVPGPQKALIGEIIINRILEGSPTKIWRATSHAAGIDQKRFMEYFNGRERAYALVITDKKKYPKSAPLGWLRSNLAEGFCPPQFMKWLTDPLPVP